MGHREIKGSSESDISRVLLLVARISTPTAIIYLGCLLPNTSSGTTMNGTGKRPTLVPPTLLPTGVYRANASRRCWCALTAPLHPYPKAVSFCGTILTIARTGRYPASLVFREPGLSSDSLESVITYADSEPPILYYCKIRYPL